MINAYIQWCVIPPDTMIWSDLLLLNVILTSQVTWPQKLSRTNRLCRLRGFGSALPWVVHLDSFSPIHIPNTLTLISVLLALVHRKLLLFLVTTCSDTCCFLTFELCLMMLGFVCKRPQQCFVSSGVHGHTFESFFFICTRRPLCNTCLIPRNFVRKTYTTNLDMQWSPGLQFLLWLVVPSVGTFQLTA
jgi:hypothetical protein